jgi:hypothetical protein
MRPGDAKGNPAAFKFGGPFMPSDAHFHARILIGCWNC